MILAFAQWCEASGVGTAIRESTWAFAVLESIHLISLASMGGTVLFIDMRLLGLGLRQHPVAALAADVWRWQTIALSALLMSGLGMYCSEAVKCYYSTSFWVKMCALAVVILFTFTIRRSVVFAPEGRHTRVTQRLVAILSLALWFIVSASGRWIGFSG
ncbi:MAG: hypothetical protein LBQ09_00305 [Acidobacteriaceae bacterium]|jgi:hypothetical protein|nr:hypothetical protein [Acidobacteriaceae bacterium]